MNGNPLDLELDGGRRLRYDIHGDSSGMPVIALHGTPGSRLQLSSAGRLARDLGVFMVVPDRPGFGGSSQDPTVRLSTWPAQLTRLADHLQFDRFVVIGLSGGGPYALAAAHALPDRVGAAITVGGVGPLVPRDPSLPPDRVAIRLARRSELAARLFFAALAAAGRRNPDGALDRFASMLAPSDQELLRRDSPVRAALMADLVAASKSSARSSARDFMMFTQPWGFELGDVVVPVHVWHGVADRNVPVEHARVIAAGCPRGVLHVVPDFGHLLLATHAAEMLEAVAGTV